MVLSDNQVRVPGKTYKVRLKCVSTQRLTTIEWLILSCTKKFERHPEMSGRTLKYAFEEVFQFQNSELLIKPCLRHLRSLGVIQIASGDIFDYDAIRFADIDLTELGDVMLKDGLLPGESREIPLDIYYNPLTGRISSLNNSNVGGKDVIDFGSKGDYPDMFPEEGVKQELQTGALADGRFTASKFRIEEIEEIASRDWDSIIALSLEADDKNVLSTVPTITAENITRLLPQLYLSREITQKVANSLRSREDLQVKNVIGSGKNIKSAVLDVCKNGKVIFIDTDVYELYKRNTASFKDRIVFLFGEEEKFFVENEKGLFISLPGSLPIEGCAVVNEKGESVSLCKAEYFYEDSTLTIPLAVEDARLIKKPRLVLSWLEELIKTNLDKNIRMAALYTLQFLNGNLSKCKTLLIKRWASMTVEEVVSELNQINLGCKQLHTEMFSVDEIIDALLEKIDYTEYGPALENVRKLMESDTIRTNSQLYQHTVRSVINHLRKPENYAELVTLFQSMGIRSHDEALAFDETVKELYTENVIKDILTAIAHDQYTKLPELFELDALFNEYADVVKHIEGHVSGLKLFEKLDEEELQKSVEACPDIAGLQSHVAELVSKNAYLMGLGINVYDTLKSDDPAMADAFMQNLRGIENLLSAALENAYHITTEKDAPSKEAEKAMRTIYILDTCAIMHNPEILLYFKDDEYVRIPTKVIDELGKIKDKRNLKYSAELSDAARIFVRDINMNYLRLFNQENKVRFLIENAALDLLPADLDPKVPDNQILSVALKYKDWEVFIVSDDGVFRLTSLAQDIKAITSTEFIDSHKEHYKKLTDWVKNYNAQHNVTINHVAAKQESGSSQPENAGQPPEKTELTIDDLPIKELKKYSPMCDDKLLSFLQTNQIKTIGDFRLLTEPRARGFAAKGKQAIYKNNLIRILKQKIEILAKIKV